MPATAEELHRFLFEKKASLAEVKKSLLLDPRLRRSFGFWGESTELGKLVLPRFRGHFEAGKLWHRVLRFRWLLSLTPFTRLVAVGNTLAFGWPDAESDIDIFLIAQRHRLFTARFFITLFLQICGLRRHGSRIAGRFCLSFFIADSELDLQPLRIGSRDPYLAFWLAALLPIWTDVVSTRDTPQNWANEFFAANLWLRKIFPNWTSPQVKKIPHAKSWPRKILEWLFFGRLGDFLEARLRNWQLTRARRKALPKSEPTAVVISPTVLKFHETDCRSDLLARWEAKLTTTKNLRKKT